MSDLTCEQLQPRARLPGTSFTEQGKTVSIAPRKEERISFFRTDTDDVRAFFRVRGQFPDLLVIRVAPEPARAVLIELKGSHWGDALAQLREGIARMKECTSARFQIKKWLALVVLGGGSAPNKKDRLRVRFEQDVGIDLEVHSAKTCDLRKYLP